MNLFMYGKSLRAPVFLAYLLSACGDRYTDVEHIQRAKDFQEAGDFASTIIELKSAVQKNPNSAEARLLLGRLQVYIGDGSGAEKEFLVAESLGLERSAFIVDLARAYHLQGNFKKLINEVDKETKKQSIIAYNRVMIDNNFSIHLTHDTMKVDSSGSQLGLCIASSLKEFGLVNHSVWVERSI